MRAWKLTSGGRVSHWMSHSSVKLVGRRFAVAESVSVWRAERQQETGL